MTKAAGLRNPRLGGASYGGRDSVEPPAAASDNPRCEREARRRRNLDGLTVLDPERCELLSDRQAYADEQGPAAAVRDEDGHEFVLVPPGDLLYGDDRTTRSTDTPYYIGRYPVTRRQWERFLKEDGYDWDEYLDPN